MKKKNRKTLISSIVFILCFVLYLGYNVTTEINFDGEYGRISSVDNVSQSEPNASEFVLPKYEGKPYALINDGKAHFSEKDVERLSIHGYEYYSALDDLGRCGYAEACVGKETMPKEERGDIYTVHPSGWQSNSGYERCHLIAFCLTGENANDHNLVTGTGYLNRTGMLPYELKIAKYIDRTGNHVMYRVTPIFGDNELVCRGVRLEACSIEDKDTNFDVFCFNVEPNKEIDYLTGKIK